MLYLSICQNYILVPVRHRKKQKETERTENKWKETERNRKKRKETERNRKKRKEKERNGKKHKEIEKLERNIIKWNKTEQMNRDKREQNGAKCN